MSNNLGKEFNRIAKFRKAEAELIGLLKFSQTLSSDELDEFIKEASRLAADSQIQEMNRDRLVKTSRFDNIVEGALGGMLIGAAISFLLLSSNPGKFQTKEERSLPVFGLPALIGGWGAAIGSVRKQKH